MHDWILPRGAGSVQGGEQAGSMVEASPTLGHVRASWASSQGLGLLSLRRSLQAWIASEGT